MNILQTQRLILRTFSQADIVPMAAINQDERVMEYFPSIQNLAATQSLVAHIQKHFETHGFALYAVELIETGEFIGFIGLSCPSFEIPGFKPQGLPIVEIGWRLSAHHWGQGYATEGAKAVLEHAFEAMQLPEIISFTAKINQPSQRVMEKIGLKHFEEDDFEHPNLDDTSPLKSHVLYRLSAQDYQKDLTV